MKWITAVCMVLVTPVVLGEGDSFGFASWNIGHFALGKRWYSTIPVSEAPKKIKEYKAFIDKADARVIGICEHEGFVGTNNTFATDKTMLRDYDGKAVEAEGLGRLNALYWKDAQCIKTGKVKFEKHSQHRYYRYARLKIAGRETCFVMTHLDWNTKKPGHEQDRSSQIAKLIEDLKDEPYVVIGADFNTESPDEYDAFFKAGFTGAHRGELKTCPAKSPRNGIDNIFVKGFEMSDVRVQTDPTLSDHSLVRCTLTFLCDGAAVTSAPAP